MTIKTTPAAIPPAKAPTSERPVASYPAEALPLPGSYAKGHKCSRLMEQVRSLKIEIVNLHIGHRHSSHSDIFESGWIGVGIICANGIQDVNTQSTIAEGAHVREGHANTIPEQNNGHSPKRLETCFHPDLSSSVRKLVVYQNLSNSRKK